jgi:hypothetical protein
VGNNLDLAIAGLGDHDVLTEVTDTALDLDVVISQSGDGKIEVVAHIPFSGRYLKYL